MADTKIQKYPKAEIMFYWTIFEEGHLKAWSSNELVKADIVNIDDFVEKMRELRKTVYGQVLDLALESNQNSGK